MNVPLVCRLAVCVSLMCYTPSTVRASSPQPVTDNLWTRVVDTYTHIVIDALGFAWDAKSALDCIVKCQIIFRGRCRSVIFDKSKYLCAPGVGLVRDFYSRSTDNLQVIYANTSIQACDATNGLVFVQQYGEFMCTAVMRPAMYQTDAVAYCTEVVKGLKLVMVKSPSKMAVLSEIVLQEFPNSGMWIGLQRNITTEELVWSDGTVLEDTDPMWPILNPRGYDWPITDGECFVLAAENLEVVPRYCTGEENSKYGFMCEQ